MIKMKNINVIASIGSFLILAFALWLEHNYLLAPCPLCVLQRLVLTMIAICLTLLIFYEHLLLHTLSLLSAVLGIILAGRQVWLQYYATAIEHGCGAGLLQLMRKYPILDFIKIIFRGQSECASIDYTILGLSLAVWSLISFIGFAIINLMGIYQRR